MFAILLHGVFAAFTAFPSVAVAAMEPTEEFWDLIVTEILEWYSGLPVAQYCSWSELIINVEEIAPRFYSLRVEYLALRYRYTINLRNRILARAVLVHQGPDDTQPAD